MKKAIAQKVIYFDTLLEEEIEEIIFEKDGKHFRGTFFFQVGEGNRAVREVIESEVLEAENDPELVEKAVGFYLKHGNVKEDTIETMNRWQFINCFTSTIIRQY